MLTIPRFLRPLAAALPLVLLSITMTKAQTPISSVPYTITAPGKYVLTTNLSNPSTATPAITISASNVQLDLDGFYVSGAGNTASQNPVIQVGNYANVTIRNGLVANDGYGIVFAGGSNSRNYTVENMIISRCYFAGITAIGSTAPGSLIRNNSFSNLGNSTAGTVSSVAIYTVGGVRIEGNLIATVTAAGEGSSFGIYEGDTDFAVGNTVSNCKYGISNGKYLNNLTSFCATPFSGGTNASGNN